MESVYLDYAATTPCSREVVEDMAAYWNKIYGNPSSLHSYGAEARQSVEQSRARIAEILGAETDEIIFTSGGTESNNTALKSVAWANEGRGNHIISTAIEHPSVLESLRFLEKSGFEVTLMEVDSHGRVDAEEVGKAICDRTIMVSVMHANNEIGTLQPIAEIADITREKGIVFHTDAVQSVGHVPVNVGKMGVGLLSASAHKFHGPKGTGFLYIRKGTRMVPFMHGGGQEKERRASTENTPTIAGMARALEISVENMERDASRIRYLRDKLEQEIKKSISHVKFNGHPTERLPNNLNLSVKHIDGEALVLRLDMEGIACSTGSACSSEKGVPSHTLEAVGLSDEWIHGTVRFSLGKHNSTEEILYCAKALGKVVGELREISPLYDI
ncbi:MAG: cysteine desulfurase family protein [Actinomycetota bacterium]